MEVSHAKHWHYIYRRRRKLQKISSRQIALGQIVALTGSLAAGYLLELNKESLALFVGAFLLLPGVIDLAASITGAMCAKITHQLDKGINTRKVVSSSVTFALLMSVLAGAIVGLFGGLIAELFFGAIFWQIFVLSIATMVIVGAVSYPLMSALTVLIRKTGADPDNIVGPVETGFTDALTVIVVAAIVRIFV